MTFLILSMTKMPTAISFLTDFLSYHTQEETLRRTLFLHTIFPCKGMKRQSNTNDRLKYRHKKSGSLPQITAIIWVFLIFYLIFLGLWTWHLFLIYQQEKWLKQCNDIPMSSLTGL